MKEGTENVVKELYSSLLNTWNSQNAQGFAQLFASDGNAIGFDGSEMNGPAEIESQLKTIFASHKVSSYVSVIREIRELSSSVYLLRAVAGMVPPGKTQINPKVNAIQTLIAKTENDQFKIALFQNTPAAFHERPELGAGLTQELQEEFDRLHK
jgi:uncharacterized protein (TIGR02246 family)